jgi:Co/Zn/Cd efflux system component
MKKSEFHIKGMDCPSEEQMIRMKLASVEGLRQLIFDIPNRKLTAFHQAGNHQQIKELLDELKLNTTLIHSGETGETIVYEKDAGEKKILWWVLGINATFFIIEMTTGIISQSMGLIADSLDMLADAFVYGLSLLAVGKAQHRKKQVAKISGYLQMLLAIVGFAEIIRRFLGVEEIPDYTMMIVVSVLALMANTVCLLLLNKAKSNDAHIKASWIFTSNDIIVNIGVICAAVLVIFSKSNIPDLIVGALVFALIMRGAFRILKLSK